MHYTIIYKGNFNWYDAYETLSEDPFVTSINHTDKGIINITLLNYFRSKVSISPKGTVTIQCRNEREKQDVHRTLTYLLGELKPIKFIMTHDWPPPKNINLRACDVGYEVTFKSKDWRPKYNSYVKNFLIPGLVLGSPALLLTALKILV